MVRSNPGPLVPGERGLRVRRGLRGADGSSVRLTRRARSGKASSSDCAVVPSRSTPKTCRSLTCSSSRSAALPLLLLLISSNHYN